MLLGTFFKRPNAPIDLDGTKYFFRPIDPANPDSEHVCVVENKQHAQKLLGIPEGYFLSEQDAPPAGTVAARPAVAAPPLASIPAAAPDAPPPPPTPPVDAVATIELSEEVREQAKMLNALSWQALKAQLAKPGIPDVVLKEALRIELAKEETDQRATTIKFLQQAIGSH